MSEHTAGSLRWVEVEAKSVLNRVRGMPFAWSINPYRGCYHRCVFCYARNTHAYLDRDGVADWGTLLSVKVNAPEVLRHELARRSWQREHVAIGTATDPYQPLEGRYRITRRILGELARARTPAHITTRSPLVVRDVDVLAELARAAGVTVCVSLPTLDAARAKAIEPTVAPPAQRLRTIRTLAQAGIRVGVAVAPVLPELTDEPQSLRAVYRAAAEAGASLAWSSVLRLGAVARESYFTFLRAEFPHLVDFYAATYRGAYANAGVARPLETRIRDARSGIAFDRAPAPIEAEPKLVQLSLL